MATKINQEDTTNDRKSWNPDRERAYELTSAGEDGPTSETGFAQRKDHAEEGPPIALTPGENTKARLWPFYFRRCWEISGAKPGTSNPQDSSNPFCRCSPAVLPACTIAQTIGPKSSSPRSFAWEPQSETSQSQADRKRMLDLAPHPPSD